ncbi:MAG: DNA adenine methylase [Treponema sp.]|uniref:DNA adenine methylase n=1 Tax=Treponema sp. TaxID=166 RepID=UPI00298DC4B0|nr:DNA adenine methylase [Treponema sp.]MBR5933805.1 DNA adenine methylase [Treponema sp.]
MNAKENSDFLTQQIITYIGNKRTLIYDIEELVADILKKLGKDCCVCADLFSGSGIVSRMLKKYSSKLICNDLENYSYVINSCYLTNKESFNLEKYKSIKEKILSEAKSNPVEGILSKYYSPQNEKNIQKSDRVFYTKQNALLIDTYRSLIDKHSYEDFKKFFLAPLITEASIHTNTSGVFKGFYKTKKTGIGIFGGDGQNALSRILKKIELKTPVFSNFSCPVEIHQENTVELIKNLKDIDITYLDPPYNQHPYGSNYFMLNLILKNKITAPVSKVSGIVSDWNRSEFNKKTLALSSLEEIIKNLDSKFFIISYNSEGFISFDEMVSMLSKYGSLSTKEIKYNTFRASRNLSARNIHVEEYLFILEKSK